MEIDGASSRRITDRAGELYAEHRLDLLRRVDRLFAALMLGQWFFGIVIAVAFSPYGWAGKEPYIHAHVYAALILGGIITTLPVALAVLRPGAEINRWVIAGAQMLWSALLIHLCGGRIETHFHVFVSLAFLSFYRDWKVLIPATLVLLCDHLSRQIYWPESVYGITNPEWWRFLEHAFWVLFEDTVLALACVDTQREMREVARRQALVETLSHREREKSSALAASQEALVRAEKLAAVGQLSASVGHELRNPLTAMKNANTLLQKRLARPDGSVDGKLAPFLHVIDRELSACSAIVSDLLDFSRERPLALEAVHLRDLVEEAIELLPPHSVPLQNEIEGTLPRPRLDRDQFRRVLINLLQNSVEAMPGGGAKGGVRVTASGGGLSPWHLVVEDSGAGMPKDVVDRIFEPLFTTKAKGTGLGMAIVGNIVRQHRGTIRVDSEPGRGTRVTVEIPALSADPMSSAATLKPGLVFAESMRLICLDEAPAAREAAPDEEEKPTLVNDSS